MAAPWIVNLVPTPESSQVKLLKPIRLSIRDSDTYIDPTTIRVVAGYAKIFSNGEEYFDKVLPATSRVNLVHQVGGEPTLSLTNNGVVVQQLGSPNQRTVYTTSIDGGPGYKSVMLTAIIKPGASNFVSTNPELGTVLAIENGPRNKAVYLWFQNTGSKILRLTSYLTGDVGTPPTINQTASFDWDAFRRYTILWNEVEGYVEVYADTATGDSRVFRVAISAIPEMPSTYAMKVGALGTLTALYGIVAGASLDTVTISNVAFTTDVAFPVLGVIRPGDFVTQLVGAELVRTTGATDPRDALVAPWLDTPDSLIAYRDTLGVTAASAGIFSMVKPTVDKTFSIYRQDPSLLMSDANGFLVDARLHVFNTTQQGAVTGTGITIFDGQTVFQLQLFQDPTFNTVGLLKKNGVDSDITDHFLPEVAIDWSGGHKFRFVVDTRRDVILFYDGDDLTNPVGNIPFDRTNLPSAADFGWGGVTPFIAVGHTIDVTTSGTFSLYELNFCHLYQAWDAVVDTDVPTAGDPAFSKVTSGAPTDGMTSDGDFQIVAPAGALEKFSRTIAMGTNRGAIIEARLRIDSWRPLTRTGTYVFLDDGLHAYALTFVETNVGKFIALSMRSDLGGFQELVGRDGDAAKVSSLLDWTEYHTYRLERRTLDGFRIYVDDEAEPRIVFPESRLGELPDEQFSGTPKLAFGQFSPEGATSTWSFIRGFFGRGYDISFKKNKPDAVLRTELFKTQALVIAHAQDEDV